MNYKIPKISKNILVKALKCLSVAAILFLGILFLKPESSVGDLPACTTVASPSPGVNCLLDCSTLSPTTVASPGVNCLYFNLPPCSGFSGSAAPRENCADLIDLPLCSQIDGTQNNLKNCVNECSTTTNILTTDHNSVCVRFCDNMPATMTANYGTNCTYRKCHQLAIGTTPSIATIQDNSPITANNCSLQRCNLLTLDELNESRLQDDTQGMFCSPRTNSGADIKCYSFVASQLPFTRYRLSNTMCKIHDCRPSSASCGTDDTLNISNNATSASVNGVTQTYSQLYQTYINVGLPLTDQSICNQITCKSIIYTPYPCSGSPLTRDANCDTSGTGSTCDATTGNCYKTTDCNLAANSGLDICKSTYSGDLPDTDTEDDTNSWYYRPKPPNKSYRGDNPMNSGTPSASNNYNYRISGMCYSNNDMKDQGWGLASPRIDMLFFVIPSFYSHSYFSPDKTRSPENCSASHDGSRGNGYVYLCGNSGNLYSRLDSTKAAYYKGYVDTTFLDNRDGVSTFTTCLRFKNAMRPNDSVSDSESCGRRECGISCAFDRCDHQACGSDVCKTLTITDNNSKECAMDGTLFDDNPSRECMATVDTYLRIRAVKYRNQICSFLDVKGQLAYYQMFLNGSEKLDNGITCISGSYNSTSGRCEGGKNTNDIPGEATKWRTALKIPYTLGNVDGDTAGFYQKDGKFIRAQECIQVPLRVAPPSMYNLATPSNTLKLFTPPLYIRGANISRYCGGTNPCSGATDATAASAGTTDFMYPSITLQFGISTKTLSVGTGYSGFEASQDPMSYALDPSPITTTSNNVVYTANVILKKEYDSNIKKPIACLYRRVSDGSGTNSDIKVGCVDRAYPDIDNGGIYVAGTRKISITGDVSTSNVYNALTRTYGNSSITLKYCDDSSCSNTNSLTITNADPSSPTCDGVNQTNVEKYLVCAQRDSCSQLYKECIENEINIQNLGTNSSYEAIRASCSTLISTCNAKKGITSTEGTTIDQIMNPSAGDSNAYGWFNELCLTSGFEKKLMRVYNHITTTGVQGKCKLTTASQAKADCVTGGGNPRLGCYCEEFTTEDSSGNYTTGSRLQTAREAGLCIDMLLPKTCPAVNYYGDTYTDSSLNKTLYNDATGVHTSHQSRLNSVISGAASGGGHGEFPTSVVGMTSVAGSCGGFWQKNSVSGLQVSPKMSCSEGSTSGVWSGVSASVTATSSPCIRYTCSAINTGGVTVGNSNDDGTYPNLGLSSYTISSETADDPISSTSTRGYSNGFALWAQYTKSNSSDFPESITGTCITGFTTNGTAPTRNCNQKGSWSSTINNPCVRITCPAVIPSPSDPSSSINWTAWAASKGASFAVNTDTNGIPTGSGWTTVASRSTSAITPGSTVNGTCNNYLGFFQAAQSSAPQRDCLSDGTWGEVRNPCVSSCTAVTSPADYDNNGNATWAAATGIAIGEERVVSGTCASGFSPYPYSAFRSSAGEAITPASVSTPIESAPQRTCKSVTVVGGTANVWTNTSSSCINKCPGSDFDGRIGVGKTQHSTSTYGTITIEWPSTNGNTWVTKTVGKNSAGTVIGTTDLSDSSQNAANYANGRTNGLFVVSRYCNTSSYRWSDPIVQCATNSGEITNTNAIFEGTSSQTDNSETTISRKPLNSGASITGTCKSGFKSSTPPQYTCQSSTNIDQYYYASSGGSSCTRITCSLAANQEISGTNSKNGSSAITINSGQAITASCKSGWGHPLGSGGDSSCGRTASDRSSVSPTATCTSTGTWSVTNDCTLACRGCKSSSTPTPTVSNDLDSSGSYSCNTYWQSSSNLLSKCSSYDIAHGNNFKIGYVKLKKCNSDCDKRNQCVYFELKCLDGIFDTKSSAGYSMGGTGYCNHKDSSITDCLRVDGGKGNGCQ